MASTSIVLLIVLIFALILCGIPVYLSMALTGITSLVVLAGEIMNRGGITQRLIKFALLLIGRMPASLAQANILSSMFFGGITGSAQADTSCIGGILNAGLDVYSEKPMATTLRDAARMAELSEKTGHKLMIGFNRRYAPVCQKAKSVYSDRAPDVIIGQKNRPKTEYHATLENAVHIVDLMRFFGGEVSDVHAISKYDDPDYETFTTAHLRFENGGSGILMADRSTGQWNETIEMHGGNRSVLIKMPDSVTVTDGDEQHTTEMTPLAMG